MFSQVVHAINRKTAVVRNFPFGELSWAERRLEDTPNIARWHDRIAARPAVQRGIAIPRGAVLA
jgi:glutathione S-transferase